MDIKNNLMSMPVKSLKVLLAEDNKINREIIETILEKKGFNAVSVKTGKEVLQCMRQQYFDLILMDVKMPVMDGFQATREIRKQEDTTGEHIPIIAMTAYAENEKKKKCLEAGMDSYISKPIKTEKLWQVIRNIINNKSDTSPTKGDISINISKAMETVEGDRELFQELIEDFLDLFPKQLSDIGKVIEQGDSEKLQKRAHSFKGAVANFGAERAYKLAFKLETLGKESHLNSALEVFNRLKQEMSQVKEYFDDNRWEQYVK